jgi:hypothetical protein
MSLGLLDPTEEVEQMLGEDIYQAAPQWARTGAELVGSFVPVMGSLSAARRLIPGVTMLPRFFQGAAAGTTLGAIGGAVEGEDALGIAQHALTEGLLFGGIEALTGIPAMIRQRQLKNLFKRTKGITPYETATVDAAVSPEAHAVAQDAEAFRYRTSPTPRTVARTQRGPLPEAQLVDQPGLLNAMEGVWTDEVHGLYGQKMVMQQFKDEEIRVVDGFLRYAKKDAVIFVEEGTGLEHRFTPKDLFSQVGSPKVRFFRGRRLSHIIPPNKDYEYKVAEVNFKRMIDRFKETGRLSTTQVEQFFAHVNPKASAINDLSFHEINYLTRLMRRGAKGLPGEKVLPDELHDLIGYMGKRAEAMITRAGAWSWFQPAHWFIEAQTKKLGGVNWLKNIHNSFLYAGQEAKKLKVFTAEVFGKRAATGVQGTLEYKAAGMFRGITEEQRNNITSLIWRVRAATKGHVRGSPKFIEIRAKEIFKWAAEMEKKWGKDVASRLQENYSRVTHHLDGLSKDLLDNALIKLETYQKELLPMLTGSEVSIETMYEGMKLPKQLEKFLDIPELGPSEKDLFKVLDRATANYTNLKYQKPAWKFMQKELRGRKIHRSVKDWLEHYAARQRGIPSKVDVMLAESLKTGFQKLPRGMPILGEFGHKFSVKDWLKVSVFFNDLPYLAHLGMRPFSAMRNLLQPMLTTGPLIGNSWLARGYHGFVSNPEGRAWIKANRLLQESLGEYEMRLSLSPRKLDQFGKWMMHMFRKSDELNRYASGLGMRAKFDHFWGVADVTSAKGMEEFFTKIKLRRFRPTTRKRIRELSRAYRASDELANYKYPKGSPRAKELSRQIKQATGKDFMDSESIMEKMRVKIVGDAIGDTQWLYGKEHAPIFTHAAGFPGRQIGVYQTWWLNYAQLMKRMVFDFPSKVGGSRDFAPLGMWMANNVAITMGLIGLGWEAKKVYRTIFLGPFPAELPDPPGLQPFFQGAWFLGLQRDG